MSEEVTFEVMQESDVPNLSVGDCFLALHNMAIYHDGVGVESFLIPYNNGDFYRMTGYHSCYNALTQHHANPYHLKLAYILVFIHALKKVDMRCIDE